MNTNMYTPHNTLPASDEEVIQLLGLDDGYGDYNHEMHGESRESSTGFEDSQRYQQTFGNLQGAHQPLNSFNNFNQGSNLSGSNEAIQYGYPSSHINKLLE